MMLLTNRKSFKKVRFVNNVPSYSGVENDIKYWVQFKTAIANKDYIKLSSFFRPDAEIYLNRTTLSIDNAFGSFFSDKSTSFYLALLSDTGSVYEELKTDTSEQEIRVIEKVGVGFVHKFYSSKILKKIVFLPYAGKYRIYEIAFKNN